MALRPADLFAEVARMHREGVPGVVATVVAASGSTPRGPGAKMIVYGDGRTLGSVGGGAVEGETIARAMRLIGGRETALVSFELDEEAGSACGGKMDVFLEPIAAAHCVAVIGGGHVGQAVAAAAKRAGFRVIVVDDRSEMVTADRFPSADARLAGGVDLLEGDLVIDEATFVVVVTRGHRFDEEWVKAVVGVGPRYIGMIGSGEKVRRAFEELRSEGVSESSLAAIHAPIGLDIGAETPDEIAVSIVAEMIAVRHGISDTAMLKDKRGHKGRNRQ